MFTTAENLLAMGFHDKQFVQFYEEIDNQRSEDLKFYLSAAYAANGPVLDAGCGSGRILLPALQLGCDVRGFDNSEAMLDQLRTKASQEGLKPNVRLHDLEHFRATPGKFHLIIVAFNTFLHLLDQRSQITFLERCYKSLAPKGKLMLDIINPATFAITSGEGKSFEGTVENINGKKTSIWRWFESDAVTQCSTYHREYRTPQANGKDKIYRSDITFRWTYPSEMSLLLRLAGFRKMEVFGDYDYGTFTDDSGQQVWIAAK